MEGSREYGTGDRRGFSVQATGIEKGLLQIACVELISELC